MRVLSGKLDALEQFANRPLLLTTSLKGHHLSWYVANVIYGTLSTHMDMNSLCHSSSVNVLLFGLLVFCGGQGSFSLPFFLQRTPLSQTLYQIITIEWSIYLLFNSAHMSPDGTNPYCTIGHGLYRGLS